MFNQILAQYYTLRSDSNVLMQLNRKSIHNLYYPYYLVKILQIVIINEERLAFMLSNIHIQSQKTTLKNDMLWTLMRPKLSFSRPTSSTPMLTSFFFFTSNYSFAVPPDEFCYSDSSYHIIVILPFPRWRHSAALPSTTDTIINKYSLCWMPIFVLWFFFLLNIICAKGRVAIDDGYNNK